MQAHTEDHERSTWTTYFENCLEKSKYLPDDNIEEAMEEQVSPSILSVDERNEIGYVSGFIVV